MTKKLAAHKTRRTRIQQGAHQRSHLVEFTKNFSLNPNLSEKDATKFRELFYSLILKAKHDERKLIAQYLSRVSHTPRPIAIYFGMDEIDIAAPMLLFSPVFQVPDLKRIIDQKSIQHLGVIARRNDLEVQTLHDLLLNDDEDGTLRDLIYRNPSVNKTNEVAALLKKTTSELRAELEVEVEEQATPEPLLNTCDEQKPKDLSKELLAIARKDAPYRAVEARTNKLVSPGEKLGIRMLAYARERDFEGLSLLINKTCLLDWVKIDNLLNTDNTGLQATLLRSLDIPVKQASQLMLLINSNIGRNLDVFKLIMLKYQNLGLEECQELYQKQGAVFGEMQPSETNADKDRKHFSSLLTQRRNSILSTNSTTIEPQEEAETLKRA